MGSMASSDQDPEECASYMKVATGSLVSSLLRDFEYPIPDVFVIREGEDESGGGDPGGAPESAGAGGQAMPVVDLSALGSPVSSPEYEQMVGAVVRASREWGCFQIVNHGVPLDVTQRTQSTFAIFTLCRLSRRRGSFPLPTA